MKSLTLITAALHFIPSSGQSAVFISLRLHFFRENVFCFLIYIGGCQMNLIFKFMNNNRDGLKWWQRNWFFATTVFVVLLNVILFAALGRSWHIDTDNSYNDSQLAQGFFGPKSHWHDCLYFLSLIQVFLASFSHITLQHVLLNMLCFFICGIYLERKLGSVKFFSLIIGFAFFGGCAVAANNNSIAFYGFSGVNFALYAYILVEYLFCVIPKNKRNKLDTIYGGVMLGLIYFAMCFNGGTQNVGFSWYPHDAFYNLAHYTSYFVGLIIATFLCTSKYLTERKSLLRNNRQPEA